MARQGNDSKDTLNGTDLIHADDCLHGPEVAPSVSVSTSEYTISFRCGYVLIVNGYCCQRFAPLTLWKSQRRSLTCGTLPDMSTLVTRKV